MSFEKPWFKSWPRFLTKTIDYPEVPLFEFLETSARRYPNKPAVIYYGKKITYKELWDYTLRFATYLASNNVKKGDRVALYLLNTPHFIISYFGILRANAVVVPINPLLTPDELAYLIKDSEPKLIVTTSDLYRKITPLLEKLGLKAVVGHYSDYLPDSPELPVPDFMKLKLDAGNAVEWIDALKKSSPPPIEVGPNDLSMIPYTAGTTGIPKGAMHTHSTVISNTVSAAYWEHSSSGSMFLSALPFFHVTGLIHNLLQSIYAGGTIVILTRWDAETAVQAIEKYKVNNWINITTMVVDILSLPDIEKRDLSSLVAIGGGGAPLPKAVGEKLKELGLEYMEGYGLTETISQTHINPLHKPKLQCLGIPDFGVDSIVIDPETGKPLPPGEVGEIAISGPEVFKGYWNKPEETEKAFIEINGKKYFRTGDIGYMDEEGYFFFVDRLKRMINRAGLKVWPTEVESILYQHPAIKEACIVPTPNERVVEEVKAYIVLKPEYMDKIKEEDIIEWAKKQMAPYKYPRIIEFVDELPKSGAGKILWRILQEKERKSVGK